MSDPTQPSAAASAARPATRPGPRMIDPRGHRFGAGVSVVILVAAFVLDAPVLVLLVAVALGASAAFGTRYSALGRPWPFVRRALRIGPPAELELELAPRFAQAIGTVVTGVAVLLFAVGATPWAWLPVALVAGLQTLLAVTGYCLGCRLYFLRWWLPALFDRLVGRASPAAW